MSLNSSQLDAFVALAGHLNFSVTAKKLYISQPALSQRISLLEAEVGELLFLRGKRFVRLTEAGQKLLRYCQTKAEMENDTLALIRKKQASLSGNVRIGASSSHLRPLIIPALSQFAAENPDLHFSFKMHQIAELFDLLFRGVFDFIVTDSKIERPEIENVQIGFETFVMASHRKTHRRSKYFIGTEPSDNSLTLFIAQQQQPLKQSAQESTMLGDVFGILDGISLGYGKAVIPKHMLPKVSNIRLDDSYTPTRHPIFLNFHKQAQYSPMHQKLKQILQLRVPELLKG